MLIPILILSASLNLSELNFDALESLYWDCDASFMKGEMGGNDMLTCLTITLILAIPYTATFLDANTGKIQLLIF